MELLDEISNLLGDINLDKSGASFYSDIKTLTKGKYLIIGLNPGGDPTKIKSTIRDSFKTISNFGYNAYFEEWTNNNRKHRLQENLQNLFKFLGEDLKKVCATNLIYERTQKEKNLSLDTLPIYRKILSVTLSHIEPDVLVCFGRKPLAELKLYFKTTRLESETIPSGHGKWTIEFISIFTQHKEIKIVGLPHLSIYTLYNRTDIKQKIKDFIFPP